MKNIFYKLSFICLLTAVFTSCEEDKITYNGSTEDGRWLFQDNEAQVFFNEDSNISTDTIYVGSTTVSDVDRTIPLIVNEAATTADPSIYTLGQLTIPAGEFVGKVLINVDFSTLSIGDSETLVLELDETQVPVLDPAQNFVIINLLKACPSDAAGSYTVTTTYQVHDFLPDFSEYTMDAAVTEISGVNMYKVADFSGGLYSVGPYNDEYGTGAPGAATQRDLEFTIDCGVITWSGQEDPWGTIVPTPGAVNTYDDETGVITISWTATGYGERGVSVYTPIE